MFFACRTTSGERYWRYVEAGGDVVDVEAQILRRISPGSAPAAVGSSGDVALETAWRIALDSIVEEHNRRADPRAAQERLGPVQRFALEVLRDPAITLPAGAAEAEQALSVERSSAVRQAIAEIRRQTVDKVISRDQAANRIVGVVGSFGLQAVEPPPALTVIDESNVGVVCWMAVLPPPQAPPRSRQL